MAGAIPPRAVVGVAQLALGQPALFSALGTCLRFLRYCECKDAAVASHTTLPLIRDAAAKTVCKVYSLLLLGVLACHGWPLAQVSWSPRTMSEMLRYFEARNDHVQEAD